ncbi:MAG: dienelactone hydrolase family protein [Methylocella sp.]
MALAALSIALADPKVRGMAPSAISPILNIVGPRIFIVLPNAPIRNRHAQKTRTGQAHSHGTLRHYTLVPKRPTHLVRSLAPLSRATEVKAPVLGLYGAEDACITPDQVEAMKERLNAAGKTTKFKIYLGARHGFFADYPQSYRADAARDPGWRCRPWFKKYKVLDLFWAWF